MKKTEIAKSLFDSQGRMRIYDGMRYYKKTEEENNMPRFVIHMADPVDIACLQKAAEKAMDRYCVQRLVVCQDDVRFYLRENLRKPTVHIYNGRGHSTCTEDNNGHMTWIGCLENQIIVEFFHGVSDGRGMLPFLRMLVGHYCAEKYGEAIPEEGNEANPCEYTEALLFLPEEQPAAGKGYSWDSALQLNGTHISSGRESACYELTVDAAAFENYMRANASSRSAVFASFMNLAIARFHDIGDKPIVGALAVDSRRAYGAESTMQCCVATIPLWLDREIMNLPMQQRLQRARQMILEGTQPERICASALGMRKFNERMEQQFPTLEAKKAHCRRITEADSGKYTYGISYVGELSFGESADRHISSVRIMLCANTIPVILEITKYADLYHISYCTHFEDDKYVHAFRQMFLDAGIPCSCERRDNYVETHANF